MMLAIDVGCHSHGADSIGILIRDLQPSRIMGCDPHPDVVEETYERDGVAVGVVNAAAWIRNGLIGYRLDGYGYLDQESKLLVQCFDLAEFIRELPPEDEIVLKLDCEGSEYPLLERLISQGLDSRLKAVWVEWHNGSDERKRARKFIESNIDCEVWEWNV
jgi:FkbM family methyltransferase